MSLSSEPGELGPRPPLSGNHQQVLQETVKNFLTKVSRMILPHNEQLTINGTIGVTVDCGQCILVHLSETVTKTSTGLYQDSRRRIPPVLPFKDEGSSPSTDDMDNSISHSFALEEDISGCTRGIVIDKEVEDDDRGSDKMDFKPLVIQPLDELDREADDQSRSLSLHRKFDRRKNGEEGDTKDKKQPGSQDDDTEAYTSKDYIKIPARLRCKSSSQSDGLRSLLSSRPTRKQRKSFMIPQRHLNSTDTTYLSSSEEDEQVIPPAPKRHWPSSGSPSKRKGLLLGMLLSNPASSSTTKLLNLSSNCWYLALKLWSSIFYHLIATYEIYTYYGSTSAISLRSRDYNISLLYDQCPSMILLFVPT
ncbi:hypothetical protein CAPTEDRAFT_185317 [Capitella teleta]|uniref:Uncharacterized protein n=1 Tax=Capitella teleta TaxID=283909 RepID=R7TD50_CAPTE|nr:hypothetical protein CAPTEDRAFT_185317 [Capitella teleta]|eukprot:ELT91412.1 hypothetical protein CAPTEDRAFT_185317 [Capitella teleta]